MRKGCLIAIIIIMGSFLGYLQYGRDMDVCSSLGISSDNYYEERLTVVTNKLYISDQKTCAEKIIERCKKIILKVCVLVMTSQFPMHFMWMCIHPGNRLRKGSKCFHFLTYRSREMEHIILLTIPINICWK